MPVTKQPEIEKVLKVQMVLTAVVMLPVTYYLAVFLLSAEGEGLGPVAQQIEGGCGGFQQLPWVFPMGLRRQAKLGG